MTFEDFFDKWVLSPPWYLLGCNVRIKASTKGAGLTLVELYVDNNTGEESRIESYAVYGQLTEFDWQEINDKFEKAIEEVG